MGGRGPAGARDSLGQHLLPALSGRRGAVCPRREGECGAEETCGTAWRELREEG